jgi:transcriptional regulator
VDTLAISPRPLTDAERRRIERAHQQIGVIERQARERVQQAMARRDKLITDAVNAGARKSDIARALGLTRQAVYDALERHDPQ